MGLIVRYLSMGVALAVSGPKAANMLVTASRKSPGEVLDQLYREERRLRPVLIRIPSPSGVGMFTDTWKLGWLHEQKMFRDLHPHHFRHLYLVGNVCFRVWKNNRHEVCRLGRELAAITGDSGRHISTCNYF